ncbi:hypothetical protein BC628DRAFT_56887 [Trametes gibbosa]|nr:hypothetical protein BC628DRAFT_56887 [Trametes gibbosa]
MRMNCGTNNVHPAPSLQREPPRTVPETSGRGRLRSAGWPDEPVWTAVLTCTPVVPYRPPLMWQIAHDRHQLLENFHRVSKPPGPLHSEGPHSGHDVALRADDAAQSEPSLVAHTMRDPSLKLKSQRRRLIARLTKHTSSAFANFQSSRPCSSSSAPSLAEPDGEDPIRCSPRGLLPR